MAETRLEQYNRAVALHARGEYARSVALFRRLHKIGDQTALVPIARAELHGIGTKRNVRAAMRKLERISRGGDGLSRFDQEQAMVTLAMILREGWLVRRDFAGAMKWLKKAARFGSGEARGLLDDLRGMA